MALMWQFLQLISQSTRNAKYSLFSSQRISLELSRYRYYISYAPYLEQNCLASMYILLLIMVSKILWTTFMIWFNNFSLCSPHTSKSSCPLHAFTIAPVPYMHSPLLLHHHFIQTSRIVPSFMIVFIISVTFLIPHHLRVLTSHQ